jgi:hypothetical protein
VTSLKTGGRKDSRNKPALRRGHKLVLSPVHKLVPSPVPRAAGPDTHSVGQSSIWLHLRLYKHIVDLSPNKENSDALSSVS